MTPVDVIVCTRGSRLPRVFRRCLEAVTAELRPEDRLLVVVDGDHGQTVRAEVPEHPGVTVLGNRGRRGLADSRNTGVAAGRAPLLCFIDDDAVLRPGWRAGLATAFADPAVIGVGGVVRPSFEHGRPWWMPRTQDWLIGCDRVGLPAPGEELRNPVGAVMGVRRASMSTLGDPFDPALGRVGDNGAGGEETDMFLRLRAACPGGRIVRSGALVADHDIPAARTRPLALLRRALGEGRSKALMAHAPHADLGDERALLRALPRLLRREAGVVRAGLLLAVTAAVGAGFLTGRRRHVHPGIPRVSAPELSVIVCTDGRRPLGETLDSLLTDPTPDLEIIIVDNSRTGLTLTRRDPRVRLVREPRRGLSHARNTGVAAAGADIVAFTDDDVCVEKQWATHLLAAFAEDGDGTVWGVTGRTLPAETRTRAARWFEGTGGFDKGPHARDWRADSADTPPLYPYPAGCFGSGNNMAFRRHRLIHLGGFATELGAGRATRGGEDLDLFRRVILAGGTLRYAPAARVRHRHRTTRAALRRQMYGYGTGMAASLGRCVLDSPAHARVIVRGIPEGVGVFLRMRGGEGGSRPPLDVVLAEALGYLTGGPLLLGALLRDSFRAVTR